MIAHFFIVTYSPKQLLLESNSETKKKVREEEGEREKPQNVKVSRHEIGEMCNKIISFGFFEWINRAKCNADVFERNN